MWAVVVNEKIVKTFEDYNDALWFEMFIDSVDAKIKRIEKDIDN